MANRVWISDGGLFKPAKKLWVSEGGTFKESKRMQASDGGVFKEASVEIPVRQLVSLAAWAGVYAHAEVVVSWNTVVTGFVAGRDAIRIGWQNTSTGESGFVDDGSLTGQRTLVLPTSDAEYRIGLMARVNGSDVLLDPPPTMAAPSIVHRTSRTPAVTNAQTWADTGRFYSRWTVGGYVDNHWVRWLDPNSFVETGGNWVGAGNGAGSQFETSWGYPQNAAYAFEVQAVRGNSWSEPVRLTGRTQRAYAPGTYYVPCQQRRTWVVGNKRVQRGYNHNDPNFLWHGHGGDWNEYGTQLACFYYWNEGSSINPFQTILNQLNAGATVASLAVWVQREFAGYNTGRHVWYQTHGHKWVPNGNTMNLQDNLAMSGTQVWAENGAWVEMNPALARWLCDPAGNGVAIGNTNVKKDYYFNLLRHSSGQLRFVLV